LDHPCRFELPPGEDLVKVRPGTWQLPKNSVQLVRHEISRPVRITLPEGEEELHSSLASSRRVYTFPAGTQIRHEAVSRFSLAWVIAVAVTCICLWGTLIGSMLPLVFKSIGVDPGIASSPFVATFVDVTGIVIYFTIASVYLL
jgi:magnesium transporter